MLSNLAGRVMVSRNSYLIIEIITLTFGSAPLRLSRSEIED
jgi:hypothetical protein